MKIKKLEIYGYGKWVDQNFDLTEGLNVFLGQNEAGKSTLMSFIHSILFGFPTRNSTFLRYEPFKSSKYGGKIIAEDLRYGELIIERVHGKVTGDVTVTLEDGTVGSDELLETVLRGLDRESFQNIFSFSLTDIENVHQLDKNKLSRYLLNIGAHSTDYYLDLVDEFQKNAYDLYRPSGRIPPLNKQLAAIKKQEKKLITLENRNKSYLDLLDKNKQENEELQKIEEKQKNIQEQLVDLKEFKKERHVFEEVQVLKNEIATSQLPPLKSDGQFLLDEYKKKKTQINEKLQELKLQIQREKESFLKPHLMEKYGENKKEISRLEQDLPEIVEKLGYLESIENQIQTKYDQLSEMKQKLNIQKDSSLPILFTPAEKLQVNNWLKQYNEADPKIELLDMELQELEYQLNLKNQKADQYEEVMWSNDYLKEIKNQIKARTNSKSTELTLKNKLGPIGIGIVGLIILAGSFLSQVFNPVVIAGFGILVLMISYGWYQRNKKIKRSNLAESEQSGTILITEYEKQLAIQAEWQSLLGKIDAIQMNYQTKNNERLNILENIDQLMTNWQNLLRKHQISKLYPLEKAEEIIDQISELINLEKLIKELTKKENELIDELENHIGIINVLVGVDKEISLSEKVSHFRVYLKELNQLLEIEEEKLRTLNNLEQQEKQLLSEQEEISTKLYHLLDVTGVESEEEFLALYEAKEALDAKKSRVQFLTENLPSFDVSKKLPTKAELLEEEEKLEEKLKQLLVESKETMRELANTQLRIKNLEKDGSYSEALQDFENQKATTQSLVDEWISDKLASEIIQSTLNQVTKDRFEDIILEINYYFSLLTNGEYENILFKEDELFVQNRNGRVVEVKSLSRGTAEPLYVAIRIAYITKMQDIIRLPIIMDDPFVNFDQQRKKNMYRLLEELSDKLQIIYFSFDLDLDDEFKEKQIIHLERG